MKNLLIFPFLVLALTACGGKKVASTSFSLQLGALVSGTDPVGGIFLMGTNGVDKFSTGLTSTQAQSFSVDLPEGSWDFTAIAWHGDGSGNVMTGKSSCGHSVGNEIQGTEANISLNLTVAECATAVFANAAGIETSTYGDGAFKKLVLNSCLNPISLGATACNGAGLNSLPGEHVSFRLALPGFSNFGSSFSSLTSGCYNTISMNTGVTNTTIRWPSGGSILFPGVINGYEKRDCADSDHSYQFNDGLAGVNGFDRNLYASGVTDHTLQFADNYVGFIGSPFFNAHAVDATLKLPLVSCGNSCFGSISTSAGDYSQTRDTVRDSIWGLFGSFDGNSPHDSVPNTSASMFLNGNLGMGQIYFSAGQSGQQGNNINIQLSNSGVGSNIDVICDENTREVFIFLQDSASQAPVDIVAAINTNCSPMFVTATVSNSAVPSGWTNTSFYLTGGSDIIVPERREVGALNRVAHMLIGPLGAALSKAGISSTQICTTGFSGSATISLPGETVIVSVAPSSAPMPIGLGSYTLSNFDKKLTLTINGVTEEAYHYNCSGIDIGIGAYTSIQVETNRINKETIFWNVESPSAERVEYVGKHYENGKTYWGHTLFEASGTSGNWQVWGMQGSDDGGNYQKFTGTKTGDTLFAQKMPGISSINSDPSYISPNYEESWTVSTGALGGNTATTSTSDPLLNPNTLADTKMNDLINPVGNIFWSPTSY